MNGRERKRMFHNTSNQTNTNRNKKICSIWLVMVIFLASFTAIFVIILPFRVEAAGAEQWVNPDTMTDSEFWNNEDNAKDGSIETYAAETSGVVADEWLEAKLDSGIECDKVHVWVSEETKGREYDANNCDIQVYYDAGWHEIATDVTITKLSWQEYAIGSTETVIKMQIQCDDNGKTFRVYSMQFNQVDVEETVNLLPDAKGSDEEWDLSGGEVPHYTMVDDPVGEHDDDSSFVYTAVNEEIEEFNHETNGSLTGANISNVRVTARCRKVVAGMPGDASIGIGLKIGGTRYVEASTPLTESYANYAWNWATNPADEQPWEKSDIDNLQSSLQAVGLDSASVRCTQVYITVTYTPGPANAAPTVGVPSAITWDLGGEGAGSPDNCYAQCRWYYVNVTYNDTNGCTNFDYVELRLGTEGAPGATYARFRYTELNNTAWIETGGDKWDLDGGVKEWESGDNITAVWKFKPQWDADEINNGDIILSCLDDDELSDYSCVDENFDVVTTLLTSSIECDDTTEDEAEGADRVGAGTTIDMPFEVRYADEPSSSIPSSSYPPDAEFTSVSVYIITGGEPSPEGTDSSIVNGDGSVSFAISSTVGSYDYQLNVNINDSDYADGYLTNLNETVIADKLRTNWSSDQYTVDEGTELTISLDDVDYYYNDPDGDCRYQYNYTIQRAGETVRSYSGNTSSSFTFTPKIAGYYCLNLTAFKDIESAGPYYNITSYQQNDSINLTVKQNISVVEGENYITWGANASVTASTLASDLGLQTNDVIRKFNQSSTGNPWSDLMFTVGGGGGSLIINRWDDLQIQAANSYSHSFTPDPAVDPSHTKTLNFTNSILDGWTYVSWTNDFSTTPANFASDLGISGDDLELNVYVESTGKTLNYNAKWPDFAGLTIINPYDVICFRAPGHADIEYNSDSIS